MAPVSRMVCRSFIRATWLTLVGNSTNPSCLPHSPTDPLPTLESTAAGPHHHPRLPAMHWIGQKYPPTTSSTPGCFTPQLHLSPNMTPCSNHQKGNTASEPPTS